MTAKYLNFSNVILRETDCNSVISLYISQTFVYGILNYFLFKKPDKYFKNYFLKQTNSIFPNL